MLTFLKNYVYGILGIKHPDEGPNLHYLKLTQDELLERIQALEDKANQGTSNSDSKA